MLSSNYQIDWITVAANIVCTLSLFLMYKVARKIFLGCFVSKKAESFPSLTPSNFLNRPDTVLDYNPAWVPTDDISLDQTVNSFRVDEQPIYSSVRSTGSFLAMATINAPQPLPPQLPPRLPTVYPTTESEAMAHDCVVPVYIPDICTYMVSSV